LSEDYLIKADLRVNLSQFRAELQRSSRLTTGRIDARFTGYTYDLLEENAQGDPEGPAVGGAFTALINSYNHDELNLEKTRCITTPVEEGIGTGFVEREDRGDFSRARPMSIRSGPGYDHQPTLAGPGRERLFRSGHAVLRHGIHDGALGLPEALQKNIKEDYYNAGHMMYLHDQDRISLHNQIAGLIDRAAQQ